MRHSSVLVRQPKRGGHITPTILPKSLCWLRKRPAISVTRSSGSPRASRAWRRASAACWAWRRSRARRSCAVRRRRCLAFACFLTDRVMGDMGYSSVLCGAFCVMHFQDFLLSFVDSVRYIYAHTALPIPTLFSMHCIDLRRVGDDL